MRIHSPLTRVFWPILVGTQACFLPVPFNETGSPPLVGFVRRGDGGPAAGRRIVVTSAYDDAKCSKAAASATTDSAGRFELPRTLVRQRGILLIPAFERFGNYFALCGAAGGDSVLREIYDGSVALYGNAPVQRVSCIEWEWQRQPWMTCSTPGDGKVVEGGRWSADGRVGRYRLVLTEELPAGRAIPRPDAYVLWIQETAEGIPHGAVETVRLPIDDNVTALSRVDLVEQNGRFYARFPGFKKTRWNNYADAELRFELGPPGQVTKVAGP